MFKLMIITWLHRAWRQVAKVKNFIIELIEDIMKSLGLVQGDKVTSADYWRALDKLGKKIVKILMTIACGIVSAIMIIVHAIWKFK